MEITGVEAYAVNVNVIDIEDGGISPYVTNHGAVEDMDRILVRVDTDEGISGWGEMRVFLSPETTIAILEDGIAPIVEGHSPFEVESLRRLLFIEYTNVDMFFSAVEIACWDIVGKALGKPIYELLGGWTAPGVTTRQIEQDYEYDRAVDVAYCVGILSPEESRVHARRALERGHDVLKTKAGRDWREDVDRILAMHDEVDGRLDFRLDPNQGWRLDEAVRVGAALSDAGVYLQYLEQPIRVDSHGSLARLRERTCQPIGPNEDTYIAHNLQSLIENAALDVAVLDMTPAGGISGVRQLAAIAEDAGVPVAHHCAFDLGVRTAAIMHTVLGVPGFSLPPDSVYYAWEDDVIEEPLEVVDGSIPVPDAPGLGVTVDEAKLAEYRIR
ncbi:mandelate racemase/muconate lactonizing enzyme family protein [Natrarchaeobius oligotrophus]|uniref:glucarate dehydratase n=1 Tax=Natrarchaeobius chitinivorans TaxID=1679083 RepID=A0A3N6NRK5_NATCH|nr:mandelate racemase/muconate lactonizing enzyme family protein [Natrarchaeobius chitinivorans]RQH02693.1 N-acylamino acid racemase [Natrarchaeobius chitinivorans]